MKLMTQLTAIESEPSAQSARRSSSASIPEVSAPKKRRLKPEIESTIKKSEEPIVLESKKLEILENARASEEDVCI
jgi:primosomal protein N''